MARSVLIGRGRGWRIDQGTDDWMIGHCPRFPKKGFIRGMVRFRLTGTSLTLVLRYLYINIPVRMFGMLYKSEPWVGRRYATEDGQTKLTNQPSGDSNSKNQAPRFRSSSRSSRTPRAFFPPSSLVKDRAQHKLITFRTQWSTAPARRNLSPATTLNRDLDQHGLIGSEQILSHPVLPILPVSLNRDLIGSAWLKDPGFVAHHWCTERSHDTIKSNTLGTIFYQKHMALF